MTSRTHQHFLALVRDKAGKIRSLHNGDFARSFAAIHGQRWTPITFRGAIQKVLLEIMHDGEDITDRAQAADLLIEGKDIHWFIKPDHERMARALQKAVYGNQEAKVKTETKPKKAVGRPKGSYGRPLQFGMEKSIAIAQETAKLERIVKSETDAGKKLAAIKHWLAAMDYLVPDEMTPAKMRASLTPAQLAELMALMAANGFVDTLT